MQNRTNSKLHPSATAGYICLHKGELLTGYTCQNDRVILSKDIDLVWESFFVEGTDNSNEPRHCLSKQCISLFPIILYTMKLTYCTVLNNYIITLGVL